MDPNKLKEYAIRLRKIFDKYLKTDKYAEECFRALEPYIIMAEKGDFNEPVELMPCGRYFVDGPLEQYKELFDAYSKFSFEAEGLRAEDYERAIQIGKVKLEREIKKFEDKN